MMSSPQNSLRKTRKTSLPGFPRVPFRQSISDGNLLSEYPLPTHHKHTSSSLNDQIHQSIVDQLLLQNKQTKKGKGVPKLKTTPTDDELLISMATRLGKVEKELLSSKREIVEKTEYIQWMEEKIAFLEESLSSHHQPQCRDEHNEVLQLERRCQMLQKQVDEMEEFLNDYGMVWVGKSHVELQDPVCTNQYWSPGASVSREEVSSINFDKIVQHVQELSILAGEGSSEVTKTPKGAQLKELDLVPLSLYRNGLILFSGPFRPYSDPSTQQVVRDLMDGYFPTELQSRYPKGVPFAITDLRDVTFTPKSSSTSPFPGGGHVLGGDKGPSRLLPAACLRSPSKSEGTMTNMSVSSSKSEGTMTASEVPGNKLSIDQFILRFPRSVIKGGRVLEIRSGIKDMLQGSGDGGGGGADGSSTGLTLVETTALKEMKNRLEMAENVRPPTPVHLVTLRIKADSANGEQTYILKMKHTETVGDVRAYIDKLRSGDSSFEYDLKTTFPTRILDNPSATLAQCGLVSSATLHMTRRT